MKPLADIASQLGLASSSPAEVAVELPPEPSPVEDAPVSIPPGLMDLFRARVRAVDKLAGVRWPQRGQILRLEKLHPTFDECPFAVLLIEPTAIPNVWKGFAVAPEDELDYCDAGDVPLDEDSYPRDPMAGFVQTWNPLRIAIPSATACLAELDQDAMDKVQRAAFRPASAESEYRKLYKDAAEYWSGVTARLEVPHHPEQSLLDRLVAQLANLAQIAQIGAWRPAVEHPMGPEDEQTLLWTLADLDIRIDPQACTITKTGGDEHPTEIELRLGGILLEAHTLHRIGQSAAIQLAPERHAKGLTLSISQPGIGFTEIAV